MSSAKKYLANSKPKKPPCWDAKSEQSKVCKTSLYFGRLAQEKGAETTQNLTKSYHLVKQLASELCNILFAENSRISRYFEEPAKFGKGDDVTIWVEDTGSQKYICRLFLKHPTLPESFKVTCYSIMIIYLIIICSLWWWVMS